VRRFVHGGADRHALAAREPRALLRERDAVPRQVLGVDAAQAQYVGVATLLQHVPVMTAALDFKAVARRVFDAMREFSRVEHDLLRHAAHVDAGSAERPGFREQRPRAVLGRTLRAGEPAAAAADHDEIPVFRHHCHARVPGGRMIYSKTS
jgi:hypothetical protein